MSLDPRTARIQRRNRQLIFIAAAAAIVSALVTPQARAGQAEALRGAAEVREGAGPQEAALPLAAPSERGA